MDRWITTTQLLEDLQITQDAQGWNRFCSHFQPVVISFARKMGMAINDAEEAAQETMMEFVRAFRAGKYDREKGRLSSWLLGIAMNVIRNLHRRQPLERLVADKTTGTSFWDAIEDDKNVQKTWNEEWRQMVLKRCLKQVKNEFAPRVVDAFRLYGLSGKPIKEVCVKLDMSEQAVYNNKRRVLMRMKELARDYQGPDGDRIL